MAYNVSSNRYQWCQTSVTIATVALLAAVLSTLVEGPFNGVTLLTSIRTPICYGDGILDFLKQIIFLGGRVGGGIQLRSKTTCPKPTPPIQKSDQENNPYSKTSCPML